MDFLTLLIFDLDGTRFGMDAKQVRESVWLPELTPVEEAPPWIVGIFSLHGRIVPVADLHLRFGHPMRHYNPYDQVVVLETDHLLMGLIVSEVRAVIKLPNNAIQPPPQFDALAPARAHLVAGEARIGDDLVTLLDVSRLVHFAPAPHPNPPPHAGEGGNTHSSMHGAEEEIEMSSLAHGVEEEVTAPSSARSAGNGVEAPSLAQSAGEGWGGGHFCPQATPEARALFHARAMVLREAIVAEEVGRLGLAVVELGGEYFGVELAAVQEFCNIIQLSPIPCCPPHILGAMSLRGDLLTLIDPRAALNLAPAPRGGKAIVARFGEQTMAIAVDAVHDVVYLRGEELQAPPPVLCERSGAEIMGTALYKGRMMTVLDLSTLLAREEWIVNENI